MENDQPYKFVEFNLYCDRCKYKDVKDEEGKEPCNTCLTEPVNLNSSKPIKFEEKEN